MTLVVKSRNQCSVNNICTALQNFLRFSDTALYDQLVRRKSRDGFDFSYVIKLADKNSLRKLFKTFFTFGIAYQFVSAFLKNILYSTVIAAVLRINFMYFFFHAVFIENDLLGHAVK